MHAEHAPCNTRLTSVQPSLPTRAAAFVLLRIYSYLGGLVVTGINIAVSWLIDVLSQTESHLTTVRECSSRLIIVRRSAVSERRVQASPPQYTNPRSPFTTSDRAAWCAQTNYLAGFVNKLTIFYIANSFAVPVRRWRAAAFCLGGLRLLSSPPESSVQPLAECCRLVCRALADLLGYVPEAKPVTRPHVRACCRRCWRCSS